jgi:UDP-N-acetylglucosamine--N-acetylmuramyl-(pentapeptide) pyrophosphoryl-undecaprenol N-acetylglucosamine transferase
MNIIIVGGGTAGHINPGLAIAKHVLVKHSKANILFIGTERGLEKDLVPREGFKIEFIKARGFKREISLDIFFTVKDMIDGYFQAGKILKEFKPEVVIGTGGYVCVPVIIAASRLKVPTIIHEANAFPGIANRILGRIADIVAISFRETEKFFRHSKKVIFTGNPVRAEIIYASNETSGLRRERLSENEKPSVLVFGGSRGAQKINEAVIELIKSNNGVLRYSLVLSTGQSQYDLVLKKLQENGFDKEKLINIEILPYLFEIAKDMASADIIVARAGAISTSEITAMGIPSILIPYPFATENHQEFNARSLEKQGAAIVILEKDLTGDLLNQQITSLVNNKEQLSKMAKNARKMGVIDAVEKIGGVIEELRKK